MRGTWEYVFYVDFLRGDDEPARNALHHLAEVADFVRSWESTERYNRNILRLRSGPSAPRR